MTEDGTTCGIPLPQEGMLRVLCLGDVVGKPGRTAIRQYVPALRDAIRLDMVVANGENSAHGIGITPSTAKELFAAGVDVITTGNHIWRHKDCYSYLGHEQRLLRPANFPPTAPGKGMGVYTLADGTAVAVLNLAGRVFMAPADCPFRTADALLETIGNTTPIVLMDFHAEASSEKRAMALYMDGRASFVFGTHTHVQTADAMILPGGTAAMTDLGMCGVEAASVLGMHAPSSFKRFLLGMTEPMNTAKGTASLNGAIADIDRLTGKTTALYMLRHNPAVLAAWSG